MNFQKLWGNVLRSLLALFGLNVFTACYGPAVSSPYLGIKGKVTDEMKVPVSGIQVTSVDIGSSSGESDVNGNFNCQVFCSYDAIPETVTLKFTDTDGKDNGGKFEEKIVTVDIQKQLTAPEPIVVEMSLEN
ncbi:MAG: hypothetical protein MJY49_05080 [Bacteroidales bacterium]|nr:hypothetical protein [Bacteroidales bacterium]